jgi:hypothetical protein
MEKQRMSWTSKREGKKSKEKREWKCQHKRKRESSKKVVCPAAAPSTPKKKSKILK